MLFTTETINKQDLDNIKNFFDNLDNEFEAVSTVEEDRSKETPVTQYISTLVCGQYQKAVENITKLNLDDQITVFLGDALKFDFTEKFDLIFIDGAKSQYINFFEKYKNNLSENGVFISDNLFFHGMVEDISLTQNYSTIKLIRKLKRYIDFLKANTEFQTEFYQLGDGVAVSRRK